MSASVAFDRVVDGDRDIWIELHAFDSAADPNLNPDASRERERPNKTKQGDGTTKANALH